MKDAVSQMKSKFFLLLLAAFMGWYWRDLGRWLEIDGCLDGGGCWDYCAEECVVVTDMSPSLETIHALSMGCQESYERCGKQ